MATTKVTPVKEAIVNENGHNSLLEASRKVLLAAIGAVALAQDEIEDFVNKLVERGEIAEKDGKKLIREVMDKRKKDAKDVEDETSKRVHDILDRMNVPSKKDIDILGDKIAILTQKVEELKKG
jgi:polyhydroxyalkanoate synthesis regulator phasin